MYEDTLPTEAKPGQKCPFCEGELRATPATNRLLSCNKWPGLHFRNLTNSEFGQAFARLNGGNARKGGQDGERDD